MNTAQANEPRAIAPSPEHPLDLAAANLSNDFKTRHLQAIYNVQLAWKKLYPAIPMPDFAILWINGTPYLYDPKILTVWATGGTPPDEPYATASRALDRLLSATYMMRHLNRQLLSLGSLPPIPANGFIPNHRWSTHDIATLIEMKEAFVSPWSDIATYLYPHGGGSAQAKYAELALDVAWSVVETHALRQLVREARPQPETRPYHVDWDRVAESVRTKTVWQCLGKAYGMQWQAVGFPLRKSGKVE